MIKEAVISDDQKYRYTLYREWAEDPIFEGVRVLNFCMLNPSTADGLQDDPTIRKCIGFAKANGYNAIRVVNLFAYRTSSPKILVRQRGCGLDVVGPLNNDYVQEIPPEETVVAAWGASFYGDNFIRDRIEVTKGLLSRKLWCVRKTIDPGFKPRPWHPLYVPYGPLMNLDET